MHRGIYERLYSEIYSRGDFSMKNFKKALALILSVLMLSSAMMFTASAAGEKGYATSARNGFKQFGDFSESANFKTEVCYDTVAQIPYAHVTVTKPAGTSINGSTMNNYSYAVPMADGAAYAVLLLRTNAIVNPGIQVYQGKLSDGGTWSASFDAPTATTGSGEWEQIIIPITKADGASFTQPQIRVTSATKNYIVTDGNEYFDVGGVEFFSTEAAAQSADLISDLYVAPVTATFVANGETVKTVTTCAGELIRVDDIEVAVPEGQIFGGWGVELKAGKNGVEGTQFISAPSSDTTYTAVLNSGTSLTFTNGADTTVIATPVTVPGQTYGKFELPEAPTAPAGKVFTGWKNAKGYASDLVTIAGGLTVADTFTAQFIDDAGIEVPTSGTVIYVNAKTGKDSNDGSASNPVSSIAGAMSKITGTGTIVLQTGVVCPNPLGQAGKDVTIMGINNGINFQTTTSNVKLGGNITFKGITLAKAGSTEAVFNLNGNNLVFDEGVHAIYLLTKVDGGTYATSGGDYIRTAMWHYNVPASNRPSCPTSGEDNTALTYISGAQIVDSTVTVKSGSLNFPKTGTHTQSNSAHSFTFGKSTVVVEDGGEVTGGISGMHDYQPTGIFMGEQALIVNGGHLGSGTYNFSNWAETGVKKIVINGGVIDGTLATSANIRSAGTNENNPFTASKNENYQALSIIEINGGTFSNKIITKGSVTNEPAVVIFNHGMADGFTVTDSNALVIRAVGEDGKVTALYTEPTVEKDFRSEFLGFAIEKDNDGVEAYLVAGGEEFLLDTDEITAQMVMETCSALQTTTLDIQFRTAGEHVITFKDADNSTFATVTTTAATMQAADMPEGTPNKKIDTAIYAFAGWELADGTPFEAGTALEGSSITVIAAFEVVQELDPYLYKNFTTNDTPIVNSYKNSTVSMQTIDGVEAVMLRPQYPAEKPEDWTKTVSIDGYGKIPKNWSTGSYNDYLNSNSYDKAVIKYYYAPNGNTDTRKIGMWLQKNEGEGKPTNPDSGRPRIADPALVTLQTDKWSYAIMDFSASKDCADTWQYHIRPFKNAAGTDLTSNLIYFSEKDDSGIPTEDAKVETFYIDGVYWLRVDQTPVVTPVNFYGEDGELAYATEILSTVGEEAVYLGDASAITKDGCVFRGWSTDVTGASGLVSDFAFAGGETVNLHPIFEVTAEEYTVTFKNGADVLDQQTLAGNAQLVYGGEAPTQAYKEFKFWALEGTDTAYDFTQVRTGDIVLVAVFADLSYSVKFMSEAGTILESKTVVGGNTTSFTGTAPAKTDYEFLGWATTQGAAEAVDLTTYIISGTTTFYPVFKSTKVPTVYVSKIGNDSNDGLTAATAYATFAAAYNAVKNGEGKIYIVDDVAFNGTFAASSGLITVSGDPESATKGILRLKGSVNFNGTGATCTGRIKFENVDFAVAEANQWSFVNFCGFGYEFGEGIEMLTGTDPDGKSYKTLCVRAGGESGKNIYGAKQIVRSGSYNTLHLAGKGAGTFGDIDFELYGGSLAVNCGNDSMKDGNNNPVYGALTNVKVLLNAAPKSYGHSNISEITGNYQFIANNGVATVPNIPASVTYDENKFWAISSAEGGMAAFTETAGTFAFTTDKTYVVVDGAYYDANGQLVRDLGADAAILADAEEHTVSIALAAGYHNVVYTDVLLNKVTFVVGEVENVTAQADGNVVFPASPEAEAGYEFAGWTYNGTLYTADSTVAVVNDMVFTAVFEELSGVEYSTKGVYSAADGTYTVTLYFEGAKAAAAAAGLAFDSTYMTFDPANPTFTLGAGISSDLGEQAENFVFGADGIGFYWNAAAGEVDATEAPIEIGTVVLGMTAEQRSAFVAAGAPFALYAYDEDIADYYVGGKYLFAPAEGDLDTTKFSIAYAGHTDIEAASSADFTVYAVLPAQDAEAFTAANAPTVAATTLDGSSIVVGTLDENGLCTVGAFNYYAFTIKGLAAGETYMIGILKQGYLPAAVIVEIDGIDLANNGMAASLIPGNIAAGDIENGEVAFGTPEEIGDDEIIDFSDFVRVARAFDDTATAAVREATDINEDGLVTVADLAYVRANLAKLYTATPVYVGNLGSLVF